MTNINDLLWDYINEEDDSVENAISQDSSIVTNNINNGVENAVNQSNYIIDDDIIDYDIIDNDNDVTYDDNVSDHQNYEITLLPRTSLRFPYDKKREEHEITLLPRTSLRFPYDKKRESHQIKLLPKTSLKLLYGVDQYLERVEKRYSNNNGGVHPDGILESHSNHDNSDREDSPATEVLSDAGMNTFYPDDFGDLEESLSYIPHHFFSG